MDLVRPFAKAVISEKAERSVRAGHPWVYGAEVLDVSGVYENGSLVDIFSKKDRFLGTGFLNDNSKIRLRILSRNANDLFDRSFYERRLHYAVEYRKTVMGKDFDCCRLIFGEADFFPGLTVDRFGDILVTQTLSLGIERIKHMLFPALIDILRDYGVEIRAIYERNDVGLRTKEGMLPGKGFFEAEGLLSGLDGHVSITENGIEYDVDYIGGQKTGFFLDQKYNREAVARLAGGKRVLDCFTHTGAFALNAAKAGAEQVCAVDLSGDALELAKSNAERNGLGARISFLRADVFELLTQMASDRRGNFDFIILDPPAFTKSSSTVKNAVKGYREINRRAMGLLPRGGYLATCSCSHFMTDELFRAMLRDASADAAVSLRQIEERRQSPDHPILWNVPETDYLKFYLFQVV